MSPDTPLRGHISTSHLSGRQCASLLTTGVTVDIHASVPWSSATVLQGLAVPGRSLRCPYAPVMTNCQGDAWCPFSRRTQTDVAPHGISGSLISTVMGDKGSNRMHSIRATGESGQRIILFVWLPSKQSTLLSSKIHSQCFYFNCFKLYCLA